MVLGAGNLAESRRSAFFFGFDSYHLDSCPGFGGEKGGKKEKGRNIYIYMGNSFVTYTLLYSFFTNKCHYIH